MVSALRACMGHGSERKLHCRPRKRGLLEVYIYIYIYMYIYIYICIYIDIDGKSVFRFFRSTVLDI